MIGWASGVGVIAFSMLLIVDSVINACKRKEP